MKKAGVNKLETKLILFFLGMFLFAFIKVSYADTCVFGVCNVPGSNYISTRAYNLEEDYGKLYSGAWKNAKTVKNEKDEAVEKEIKVSEKEEKNNYSYDLKFWFDKSVPEERTIIEYIHKTIPANSKAIVEKRNMKQRTYLTYDIFCEFHDENEGEDGWMYSHHGSNEGYKDNEWEEHRIKIKEIGDDD